MHKLTIRAIRHVQSTDGPNLIVEKFNLKKNIYKHVLNWYLQVVLPKLAEIIRTSYDPVSTSQTVRLIGILTGLVRGKQIKNLQKVSLCV